MTELTHKTTVTRTFGRNAEKIVMVEPSHEPDIRAKFALNLIQEWGKVPFAEDGEDSAGRQKAKRIDAAELVDTAVEAAELAFKVLFYKGWMVEMPPLNLTDEADEK